MNMFEQIEAIEQKIENDEKKEQEIGNSKQYLETSISKITQDLEVTHLLEKNVKDKKLEIDQLNRKKEEYTNELRAISNELETQMLDTQREIGALYDLEEEDRAEAMEIAESKLSWVTECQDKIKELDEKYHLNLFFHFKESSSTMKFAPHSKIENLQIDLKVNESKFNMENYKSQLDDFEFGLNHLSVYDFIHNYENAAQNGRGSSKAQQEYRYVAIEVTAADKMEKDSSLSYEEARQQAQEEFKYLDSLHLPDQKVGGFSDLVTSLGDRRVNRSIGRILTRDQGQTIYAHVLKQSESMSIEEQRNTYLNISLNIKSKK